jgi:hypothetical protein
MGQWQKMIVLFIPISHQCLHFSGSISSIVTFASSGVKNYLIFCKIDCFPIEQDALKNVNNCLNANIDSYLETSGGQSSYPYLMLFTRID